MDADPTPSVWRRRRVLLLVAPLAGTLGATLGLAFGLDGLRGLRLLIEHVFAPQLQDLLLANSLAASLLTLGTVGLGGLRTRPFHALKAGACIASALLFPGMLMGICLAASGC